MSKLNEQNIKQGLQQLSKRSFDMEGLAATPLEASWNFITQFIILYFKRKSKKYFFFFGGGGIFF